MPPQPPSYSLHRPTEPETLAEADLREAMLRICELADVNPPSRRTRRLLAFSGVATLWVEAALLLAVPVGLA